MVNPESPSFFAQVGQYSWCITIVSVFLVLIGWRVAYKNAVRLATRSETKSLIDAISKLVNEISDLSIDYWLNKSNRNVEINEKKIKGLSKRTSGASTESSLFLMLLLAKVAQVSKLVDILKTRGLDVQDMLLSNVYEKASLDCEFSYKFTKHDRAVRAQEVMDSCMSVIQGLYDTFQKSHPPAKVKPLLQIIKEADSNLDKWHKHLTDPAA